MATYRATPYPMPTLAETLATVGTYVNGTFVRETYKHLLLREEFEKRWREAQKLPYWQFIATITSDMAEYTLRVRKPRPFHRQGWFRFQAIGSVGHTNVRNRIMTRGKGVRIPIYG